MLKILEILLEIIRSAYFFIVFYLLIKYSLPNTIYSNGISLFFSALLDLVMWGISKPIQLKKTNKAY